MMKKLALAALAATAFSLVPATSQARARVDVRLSFGAPAYAYRAWRPVYYAPRYYVPGTYSAYDPVYERQRLVVARRAYLRRHYRREVCRRYW